jgi:hypothetical protein
MITVYKKVLKLTDEQVEMFSPGDKILTAQVQGENICLWYLTETTAPPHQARTIYICGTGHEAPHPDDARYIGSVQHGLFVWHVFEGVPA